VINKSKLIKLNRLGFNEKYSGNIIYNQSAKNISKFKNYFTNDPISTSGILILNKTHYPQG